MMLVIGESIHVWGKESESESHSVTSGSLWPHGILQAKILEWVAFVFYRGSSQPRDWTQVSQIAGRFYTSLSHKGSEEYWNW